MTKAADDFEAIRRRLEEIEAEQKLALTGSSAPVSEEPKNVESVYGIDYSAWSSPVLWGDKIFFIKDGTVYETPSYLGCLGPCETATIETEDLPTLKSTAHPEWPYAGTAHEWRGFVNQK